jgi:hypothetical protein
MPSRPPVAVVVTLAAACLTAPAAAQTLLGPSPYLSIADSPFDLSGLGSTAFLEDFEDAKLNVPGAYSCSGNPAAPSGLTDSVDADDGAIDGFGTGGYSYFANDGPSGIRITFSKDQLGAFPTFAGLVWTDGGIGCSITFEAFDAGGASLGTVHMEGAGDGAFSGTTAEDRFCGAEFEDGISEVRIRNSSGGIEIDHIQYGGVPPQHFPACYADCDEDGELSFFDFLCYTNAFSAKDPYADCDTTGCTFSLDLFDFLCYTNEFNGGC